MSQQNALTPNAGGGSSTDKYSWTQTLGELEIQVVFQRPKKLHLRELCVKFTKRNLYVAVKGEEPIIDGVLPASIVPEECVYMFDKENVLIILLVKSARTEFWRHVIRSEPPITTTGITIERVRLSEVERIVRNHMDELLAEIRLQ